MPLKALHSPCRTIVLTERLKNLRPQLHPDMGQIVICARVARWLTYIESRKRGIPGNMAARAAHDAAWCLPLDYPGMLRFSLHSLGVYLSLGWTSHDWLASVLEAAHYGHSFRRCFFFEYKATRSPYPRVTNRGVQTSQPHTIAGHENESNDA